MNRSSVIKTIMGQLNEYDIVVASTGYISREVFRYDRDLNFYVQGSMGAALAIGIGIALHTDRRVFVINGDGASLMSLGSMVTAQKLRLMNLYNFILDNNCHESTGGQPTSSDCIDFCRLYFNTIVYEIGKDETIPPIITLIPKQIAERFKNALLCQQVK